MERNKPFLLESIKSLNSPESISKRSKTLKETLSRPEIREKYSKAAILSLSRPEVKEKLSEKSLEWFSDEDNKKFHSEKVKESLNNPNIRKKLSDIGKKSKRKEPIWHSPMKEMLYEIWINIDKPNDSKFRKHVVSIGFPDISYAHMVNNYFKKGKDI